MIRFCTRRYVATHGRRPKGRGCWWFQVAGTDEVIPVAGARTLSEAKAEAKKLLAGRHVTLEVSP